MKRHISLLLVVLAALAVGPSLAQDIYSERTIEIARRLQCPVCAGESVADSNSELSRQMRGIIEQKVQAGESDEQIIQFFVDRYGQSIVVEPPKSGSGLALWWLPVLVVLVGALVVTLYLRDRTVRRSGDLRRSTVADDEDELEDIAREALASRGPERTAHS